MYSLQNTALICAVSVLVCQYGSACAGKAWPQQPNVVVYHQTLSMFDCLLTYEVDYTLFKQ